MPHYPYLLPKGWVWTILPELCIIPITDGTHQTPTYTDKEHGIPFISSKDVTSQRINWDNVKYITKELHEELYRRIAPQKDDILLAKNGTTGVAAIVEDSRVFDIYVTLAVIRPSQNIYPRYLYQVINSNFCKEQFNNHLTGIGLPNLHLVDIKKTIIPLPPFAEQQRIVAEIEKWFALIDQIEQEKSDLQTIIKQTKSKILDLAIHGKLVPQDPNDEPAIELLKRINPNFTPCDNGHSEKLPNKWCYCSFKDIFIEITSKPYQILQSRIKGSGKYPVISQSANFVEGYSDENNVFQHKRPCIIFGDHTRNVKYIDFDFIVGADGVKILSPKVNEKWAYYLIVYASAHIENKGYSRHFSQIVKFSMMLPPLAEQQRIVSKIEKLFEQLDYIENSLEA